MTTPSLKYAPLLKDQLATEGTPGYVRNLAGAQVSMEVPGAAYAVAEITANAIMLMNKAYSLFVLLRDSGRPGSTQLAEIAWVSYLQMAVQVGRNTLILADLCDRFHLPTSIQSERMARYGIRLDSFVGSDPGSQPIRFRYPNDWRVWANKWNQSIVDAEPTTGTLPMSGTSEGMGFLPLPALIGASGLAIQLATGATIAVSWPAILVVGVVGAAVVIGVYGVSKGADWWTEHDRTEQAIVQTRLSCFDTYAQKYADTGDPKYRDIMLKCAEQADQHTGTNWTAIAYLAAGAVALLAISNIYKTSKSG